MQSARFVLVILCLATSSLAFGQKEDWLPLTDQDFQMKEIPGNSGAPAVQLYYANYIDDSNGNEFEYHRIKILNESGKKYADVEIIGGFDTQVGSLKARTIHPDRTIVEFKGKPFEKTLFKGHGIKLYAKTFTLPEVTVGSIIEYKFKLNNYSSDTWVMQHDLYTLREDFSFHPRQWGERLSWVGRNITGPSPAKKDDGWQMEWQDVPAFEAESNMPPERNYKPTIHFYYVRDDINNADKFWQEIGKFVNEYFERAIGNRKEIREAALQAIGNETDPEKKLRKLYDRAQQIRNLSYERELSAQERKKEKIKGNENLGDVLKRGYGDSEDITSFFVGMARAAGFDASMLLVSNRREEFFSNKLLSLNNLTGRIALVKLNGKDLYLQPGVRFCPFGLLRWANTSTEALKFDKKGGTFITIPALTNDRSVTRRLAKMELSDDGSLRGQLTVEFRGEEALVHRLDAIDSDEAGRKKDLEEEVQGWLPNGAVVKLSSAEGWDAPYEPLSVRFSVDIPAYATSAGKRLLIPSLLFQPQQKDAFKHAERKYPVYFAYAFSELDRVEIKLPAGYTPESIPPKQDVSLDYAHYQSVSSCDGKYLVSERGLGFNAIYVQLPKYAELKEFMARIQASDEQQAVMKMGTKINAQGSN